MATFDRLGWQLRSPTVNCYAFPVPYPPEKVRLARWRLDQMLRPRTYLLGAVLGVGLLLLCAGASMMWGEIEFDQRPWGPPWISFAGGGLFVAAWVVFRSKPPKAE